jgi:hypothetical protein
MATTNQNTTDVPSTVIQTPAPIVEQTGTTTAPVAQVVAQPPKVEEKQPVVEVVEKAVAPSTFAAQVENLMKNGTTGQRGFIAAMEKYLAAMHPGKQMDGDDGARHQFALWRAISTAVERLPYDEFKTIWTLLLGYFEEYKDGVFHDRYIYRFAEYWTQKEDDLHAFQRIINILKLTSNPAMREKGMKQVDLNRSLAVGYTEEGRGRILTFYKR